jgi:hypothetical protein
MRLGALIVLTMLLALAGPSHADAPNYYGDPPRAVAQDLDCEKSYKVTAPPGESDDYYMAGVCRVGKVRLGLATFRGPGQQAEYKALVVAYLKAFYPPGDYYFASDKGAFVQTKHYTRKGAIIAKRRLGATVTRVRVD